MARIDTLTNFLTDVATAIKDKKGSTDTIKASDFDTEIANLPSGENKPETGFVINEWDDSGYATTVTFYGNVPPYACANDTSTYANALNKNLQTVILSDNVTEIKNYAFYKSTLLQNIDLNNVKTIGARAFGGCSSLNMKTLPDGFTTFSSYCEFDSAGLTQLSMRNVSKIVGNSTGDGTFVRCSKLKAVWIGSAITSNGIGRYSFYLDSNLTKIFIDLPRATVEAMTNYQYAFMNDASKIGIIICNDDEGFITKEEFDAIDWSVV